MRYFVISGDGSRYGPADVATLNQWAREGRLLGTQFLEPESGGAQVLAANVPGLTFGPAPTGGGYAPPGGGYAPGAAAYPRGLVADASGDLRNAWIFGVLSLFCCGFIFGALGLQACKKAEEKGANAMGPKVLNIIGIALTAATLIFRLASIGRH